MNIIPISTQEALELLTIHEGTPLADTRIIAEHVGVDHRSLYRLVTEHRAVIESSFGQVRFEIADGSELPQGGRAPGQRFALLTEDQSTFLITLSKNTAQVVRFKIALVKAFAEAKRQLAEPQVPKTLSAALLLAGRLEEERERLAVENEALRPKGEFVDRYVEASGNKGFRQVAKLLGANESRFREFITDEKILYRLGGEWMPYQQHIDAGRFAVKAGVSRASEHAFNQALFTPKGIEWIAGLWAVHSLHASGLVS